MKTRIVHASGFVVAAALLLATAAPAAGLTADPATPTTLGEQVTAAAQNGAGDADELAAAVGLPVEGPLSLTVEDDGRLAATVVFTSAPSEAQRDAVAALARIDRAHTFTPSIAVTADPLALPALERIEGVLQVVPVQQPQIGRDSLPGDRPAADRAAGGVVEDPDFPSCRAIPSDSDSPLAADTARDSFDVDGTGVQVGILSDSFAGNPSPARTAEQDVAMGVLPGPGNPCRYTTPVKVLQDYVARDASDEGRGMAQLVHGIAPGAEILFATAYIGGQYGFADNIVALAEAGADVIVDDVGYSDEPHFQQGVVSAAVTYVKDRYGVAYYSSAGNSTVTGRAGGASAGRPISAWSTSAYRPTTCPDWVDPIETTTVFDCLDWDPTSAAAPFDTLRFDGSSAPSPHVSWAEPMFSPAFTRFELQLYDLGADEPRLVATSSVTDAASPTLTSTYLPGEVAPRGEHALVLVRNTSPGVPASSPAVWVSFFGRGLGSLIERRFDVSTLDDRVGSTSTGHPADGSAIGVGAADRATPGVPEYFTSFGPGEVRFEPADIGGQHPSPALATPIEVPAPRITGVDGARTSFFGRLSQEGGETVYRFFGTSAAAPSVAAVHALGQSYLGAPEADLISTTIEQTAATMANPWSAYVDDSDVFGAGLADADALLGSLPAPAPAVVDVQLTDTSVSADWPEPAPPLTYLAELMLGDSVVQQKTVPALTTNATFVGLAPEETYRVRVTSINPTGEPGGSVESVPFTTPRPARPGVLPSAPAVDALTSASRGDLIATPARVRAGDDVAIAGLPARMWTAAWIYSAPVALDWAWSDASGSAKFRVPASAAAGAHRVAVTDENGSLIGWVDLDVTAAAGTVAPAGTSPASARAGLATTGTAVDGGLMGIAAAALLAGAALIIRRRSTATRRA